MGQIPLILVYCLTLPSITNYYSTAILTKSFSAGHVEDLLNTYENDTNTGKFSPHKSPENPQTLQLKLRREYFDSGCLVLKISSFTEYICTIKVYKKTKLLLVPSEPAMSGDNKIIRELICLTSVSPQGFDA